MTYCLRGEREKPMRKLLRISMYVLILFTITAIGTGCSQDPEILHVWFANSESDFSITGLYVKTESGSWSSSFIPANQVLPTNQYFEFDIPLDQGSSTEYYVTVLHDSTQVLLQKDPLDNPLSILHWSSTTRYKHITITTDLEGNPIVSGEGGADYFLDEFSAYTKVSWQ